MIWWLQQHTAWLASQSIAVQPICLPHGDDKFEERILCMTSGWGKISETERGTLEVHLFVEETMGPGFLLE